MVGLREQVFAIQPICVGQMHECGRILDIQFIGPDSPQTGMGERRHIAAFANRGQQ